MIQEEHFNIDQWYIESFYKQNRIHQGLNYLTPNEFENELQILAA
ncbi:hypothetical protein [Lactococcus lactis]|nr:hypothetical protein [Lactococcus lactis]ADA64928.1 Transposase, fragment [Lactococcus lactis subsp. lactis KF147]